MSLSRVILPNALLRAGAATGKGDSIFGKAKKKIKKKKKIIK